MNKVVRLLKKEIEKVVSGPAGFTQLKRRNVWKNVTRKNQNGGYHRRFVEAIFEPHL